MQMYAEETEVLEAHMIRSVLGMFDGKPNMQRIIKCGLLGIEYDDEIDTEYEDSWPDIRNTYQLYSGSHRNLAGDWTRVPGSAYHGTREYWVPARSPSCPAVPAKESDSERKARLLQEAKRIKEKAEKKRLKKQRQKQRKQLEKQKQNPGNEEGKEDGQQREGKKKLNSGLKAKNDKQAAAKDSDSEGDDSERDSSDEDTDSKAAAEDSEVLDLTSSFVSKAALIAKRKLEQKPKDEKDKKKNPEKEKPKALVDGASGESEALKKEQKKDSAAACSSSFEDNVKISTELGSLGNKFASTGDFNMAVKYFTDAIKYNPTEFRLFGNRSFCYEKRQEYDKALTDAELSLSINPGWVKGLFRKGRALAGLKRYDEAADAFKNVLKLESSYAEAAQELMRVQMIQLMEFGFTREQSSNALIIHSSVDKALEALSNLNQRTLEVTPSGAHQPAQVANVNGVSPILSANISPPAAASASAAAAAASQETKQTPAKEAAANATDGKHQLALKLEGSKNESQATPELFPVWVGNLFTPVTESTLTSLFSEVGVVHSVKLLHFKSCAFVNFTRRKDCDEAIRRLHGYELAEGVNIVVRYPDRIPPGMNISRSALKAKDMLDEKVRRSREFGERRFFRSYRPDQRGGS